MEMLHLKLKNDLMKLALEYKKSLDIDIDEEQFKQFVIKSIDEKNINFSFTNECKVKECDRCSARVWKDTPQRCSHKIYEGNYCKKHNIMIKNNGFLRFGDINQERPAYDLIKLKNGVKEKLFWREQPLEQLQSILNQQQNKVILTTPKLILD